MQDVDDIVAHYGIKGMRWGIRRTKAELAGQPEPITIKAKPGQKIKTAGGKNQPVSEDAKEVAIVRQKAKASGPQSLTNKEMQTLVTRMNLEQQYKTLTEKSREKSLGEKFTENVLDGPVPKIGLAVAKVALKDAADPRVKLGLSFAEMVVGNGSGKKKKK